MPCDICLSAPYINPLTYLLIYLHGLFKEPIIGPMKSKIAESSILKIDITSFFSAEGGPIWIKFCRLVQNDIVDCGDMVKIKTRCRIPIWRTFGRIP